ncbi:MAG: NUDIX hydrolase [Acidimicrobiales bacterium mtb01]|nr:NUDIX domain-containing protein [Actinomycetota bacterium]TEX48284.1 MAG: NUDIX hydrolase [Acidimicrobiales bacterium mtb01]
MEQVAWVDDDDRVIEIVSRKRMRSERLRHRAVFIAVTDGTGRLLVHRRSPSKDVWPGWCDVAVGGVVGAHESYDEAAVREVAEEIGVRDAAVASLDDGIARAFDDDTVSLFGRCYQITSQGPFTFTDGEITEAWWVARNDLAAAIARDRFLPDSLALLLPLIRW